MVVLTAEKNPHTDLWLNGRNVSIWTVQCRVPAKPGRIGWGWADMLVGHKDGSCIIGHADASGNIVTRRKYGFVKWMPTN